MMLLKFQIGLRILRSERIESAIFILLALLMRRHVAKMHVCLKQEVDAQDLADDFDTVTWVVEAASEPVRQNNSSTKGLPISNKYSNGSLADCSVLPDGPTAAAPPPAEPASPVPTIEALATDKVSIDTPGTKTLVLSKPSPSDAEITGTWYGFHWTETQKPFLPITTVNFKCGDRQPESETKTAISGDGDDRPDGSFEIYLNRTYTDDGTWIGYYGTFLPDQGIIVPASVVMCARPLVTSALNAKELWSFALNAVVNDIRRKQPGVLYLCERMTNVHRVLTLRYGDDRDRLNEAETAEYSKLLMTFSFEEMSEVRKLYHWYDRVGDLQP
ncbi:hypothetical protein B0H14DRAFT_3431568 [Mycena olivaceomarginata]|nr:hypothetical protein B0H14DRAFT_3431568 [Mycena olivaceomarginata]